MLINPGPMYLLKSPSLEHLASIIMSGTFLLSLLPRTQCWCVDGVSKFALKSHSLIYRIELPNETQEEKACVEEFKTALRKIIRFEKTPCPFQREFEVEGAEEPESPTLKKWKGPNPRSRKWGFDRRWRPEGEEGDDARPSSEGSSPASDEDGGATVSTEGTDASRKTSVSSTFDEDFAKSPIRPSRLGAPRVCTDPLPQGVVFDPFSPSQKQPQGTSAKKAVVADFRSGSGDRVAYKRASVSERRLAFDEKHTSREEPRKDQPKANLNLQNDISTKHPRDGADDRSHTIDDLENEPARSGPLEGQAYHQSLSHSDSRAPDLANKPVELGNEQAVSGQETPEKFPPMYHDMQTTPPLENHEQSDEYLPSEILEAQSSPQSALQQPAEDSPNITERHKSASSSLQSFSSTQLHPSSLPTLTPPQTPSSKPLQNVPSLNAFPPSTHQAPLTPPPRLDHARSNPEQTTTAQNPPDIPPPTSRTPPPPPTVRPAETTPPAHSLSPDDEHSSPARPPAPFSQILALLLSPPSTLLPLLAQLAARLAASTSTADWIDAAAVSAYRLRRRRRRTLEKMGKEVGEEEVEFLKLELEVPGAWDAWEVWEDG